MSRSSETRALTDLMRSAARAAAPSIQRHRLNAVAGVSLDRRYGRRRYMLEYTVFRGGDAVRAGTYALLDTTYRTLHVRPASRIDDADELCHVFRTWSHRTGYVRALIAEALDAGYTLERWSETLETLDTATREYFHQRCDYCHARIEGGNAELFAHMNRH